jgi:predicted aspartyl protease
METGIMGRVTTEATIESMRDLYALESGHLTQEKVRRITVPDALVDTGATLLSLPASMLQQLGLKRVATKWVRSSTGTAEVGLYDAVRLTVQGRSCTTDVLEVPEDSPVLIGQLPLENLDLVVDLRGRQLTGNPAHGGEQMFELY